MRELGMRVASAALAACMMASVLPVGAFAAESGNDHADGVSIYADEASAANVLSKNGANITTEGTYTMEAGAYTGIFAVNVGQTETVTINIEGDITRDGQLFRVINAGKLIINNAGNHTVNTGNGTILGTDANSVSDTGEAKGNNGSLEVNGGTYRCTASSAFNFQHNGDVALTNVSVESNKIAVVNNGTGTITLKDGKYSGSKDNSAVALLNNKTGSMVVNAEEVSGDYTAVFNKAGTVTIDGGTYTSENSFTVSNGSNAGTLNINGGTFKHTTGEGKVINNSGTMTIGADATKTTEIWIEGTDAKAGAVINGGTLTINRGTITAPNGTGIMAVNAAATTINGGVIKECNNGIGMQSGTGTVTIKDVTLQQNAHDISLRENQIITFDSGHTGSPSIRVYDPKEGRQLTHGTLPGEVPESHNSGYSVITENDGNYYLHQNNLHVLTLVNATAQKEDGVNDDGGEKLTNVVTGENVATGTKVYLTAAVPVNDTMEFDQWVVTNANGDPITGSELDKLLQVNGKNATLTMPDHAVTIKATYKAKNTPGDSGIILPTTRAELAMLIWEKADKPAPESKVLFEDIDEDDTDLQVAARWMVEQELMDEKDDNKFKPEGHVTKLRVCTTWNEAREKGLID